ncbi:unnamed protein product [Phyllotreta striolata]|uniref:Pyrroline-5-carboxylate reductase n=1 Tax=Phyllotreta striolata TaxID=444603 RepID=A0A9N9TJA3_PHYSR|nr:unnamed protein product [Phyllotreta striolata]
MAEPNLTKPLSQKIGFIGGGNMAKAICEGLVSKGLIPYEQIHVSGPRLDNLTWWSQKGCKVFEHNGYLIETTDVIFICVKPHILQTAIDDINKTHKPDQFQSKLYISILAGVTLQQLASKLHPYNARIIRTMPNTPMTVGEGCTLYTPHSTATKTDIELLNRMLSSTGLCREIPEHLIDTAGALTGSGPAFVYMMLEALADGAVFMGLPRAWATEFAAQMALGAAKMARDSTKHTGQLKDEVCSPGGSTIRGVRALEEHNMRAAFMDAIEKAALRSAEIGKAGQ